MFVDVMFQNSNPPTASAGGDRPAPELPYNDDRHLDQSLCCCCMPAFSSVALLNIFILRYY